MNIMKMVKWGCSFVRTLIIKLTYGKSIKFDYGLVKKPVYFGKNVSLSIDNGSSIVIGGGTYFCDNCRIIVMEGAKVCIAEKVYWGNGCRLFIRAGFICEREVMFADNVSIYDHNHEYRNLNCSISKQGFRKAPIKVGEGSWLATNVVVTMGSVVGSHVVIGANSILKGVYEDECVYACNLAQKIKNIKEC